MQSDKSELTNVVESILFVAGQGVDISDIAEKLELPRKEIEEAIEQLKEKHKDDGFNIITYSNSAQMCSNDKYAEDIATVLNPIREKQLTKAALETAAIVAYKQPVTRLDIEQVRGVNSDYALQVLTNFKLIEIVGRKDAVGKPLLFGTTDEFLKRFGLQSINDLPDYEELLNRIEVLHKETTDSLYKSTEIIAEEDLPDSEANQKNNENAENNNSDKSEISEEESLINANQNTENETSSANNENEKDTSINEDSLSNNEINEEELNSGDNLTQNNNNDIEEENDLNIANHDFEDNPNTEALDNNEDEEDEFSDENEEDLEDDDDEDDSSDDYDDDMEEDDYEDADDAVSMLKSLKHLLGCSDKPSKKQNIEDENSTDNFNHKSFGNDREIGLDELEKLPEDSEIKEPILTQFNVEETQIKVSDNGIDEPKIETFSSSMQINYPDNSSNSDVLNYKDDDLL